MHPSINPNSVTPRLDPGRCAVCRRPESVPADQRDRLPAFCSKVCQQGWIELLDITSPATHVVEDDEWVPVVSLGAAVAAGYQRMEEIADATQPVTPKTRVVPVGPPMPSFPAVDLAVAEASPPITPVTPAELAALRAQQPPPRPVPGGWLRRALNGVFG